MKRFKASGILYSNGETIGLTKCRIDGEDLEGVVKRSPEKIPVVSSFEHWRNPENVIGHATLEYVTNKGNPHIDAHITFNAAESEFYEDLLNKDRKAVRLGFMIRKFKKDKNGIILHDGVINLVTLSPDALGGYIYNFGWEDDVGHPNKERERKMKRFFGMMPVKEIERTETFKDDLGLEVRIDAGPNGWTVRFADMSSRYKDVSKSTDSNFEEAYQVAVECVGKLTPIKRRRREER